jgi:hypothetical protein
VSAPLLAAAFAATLTAAPARAQASAAARKTYGVLLLAYDVDVKWRQELGNLRGQLKGHAVESVDSAGDAISVQRALDRLVAQHVTKIVAIPIETVSESTRMDMTRYLFGVRADPVLDVPGASTGDISEKAAKPLRPAVKSGLVPPKGRGPQSTVKALHSPVPLVLAQALDKSPLLVAILADRAKKLALNPAQETLVLVGVGPRSDEALKTWKTAAQAIAQQVGAKAGFRKAVAVSVRDGVRSDQQDKDRAELRTTLRALVREGRVTAVPLSPEADRLNALLKKTSGGSIAYRWNGQGIQGDRRVLDWIKASAEAAAALPDGRQFKNDALDAPFGGKK